MPYIASNSFLCYPNLQGGGKYASFVSRYGGNARNGCLGYHDHTTYPHPLHISQECAPSLCCAHICHIHTTIVLYATPTCRRGYIQYKYKYTGYIQYKYKYSTYSTSTADLDCPLFTTVYMSRHPTVLLGSTNTLNFNSRLYQLSCL